MLLRDITPRWRCHTPARYAGELLLRLICALLLCWRWREHCQYTFGDIRYAAAPYYAMPRADIDAASYVN